jgi:hypothetical protein
MAVEAEHRGNAAGMRRRDRRAAGGERCARGLAEELRQVDDVLRQVRARERGAVAPRYTYDRDAAGVR